MRKTLVCGVGNALIDSEYRVSDNELAKLNLTKGCMELNDESNHINLSCNLRDEHGIVKMMPGGSVIGCPKIRTLELLNSQEKEDRNIFTGSFGIIKFNEDLRFNIIIRSILNFQNKSEISAASGVVLELSLIHI